MTTFANVEKMTGSLADQYDGMSQLLQSLDPVLASSTPRSTA